jgi:hypothetical protein
MPDAMLAGDRQGMPDLRRVESEQLRGRGGGTEGADRSRRVEPLLVMMRMDRFRDLALDFEAGEEGLQELRSRCALAFADGQRCDQRRHRRVRQEAEDAVGTRGQLRVVEVECVAARAVDEGGGGYARAKWVAAERGRLDGAGGPGV